jgi:hypothetical protein
MSSCVVNKAIIKQDYDFSSVKTIRVKKFSSGEIYNKIDGVVQNAFIQYLLSKGYNVVLDSNIRADAVIGGRVTAFRPESDDVIFCTDGGYIWVYPDYFFENDLYYRRNRRVFFRDRVIFRSAVVGISAYMTDVKTGQVVWSDSLTFESLNTDFAIVGAVKSILKTIPYYNADIKIK